MAMPLEVSFPMVRFLRLMSVLLVLAATPAWSASFPVTLPAGTKVWLRATQDVLSNKVKAGQVVDLTVTAPVAVRGVTLIAKGARGHAVVVYARGSGVGFGGEMMVSVLDAQAVDGTWIPLRAQKAAGDGVARLLPERDFDRVSAPFPSGRNLRLSYQRAIEAYVDAPDTFIATRTSRGTRISLARPPARAGSRLVLLPDGLPVRVHPTREISSGRVSTGDRVDFITVAPVEVNGLTVIDANAPATGTVLLARKAQRANKGGVLVLSVDRVRAVDGSQVRLSASSAGRGNGNKIIGAAINFIVPFVGLAVEGREAVVPQDKELDVFVMTNRWVNVPVRR
jgi:hypothetical protein